MNNEESQVFKAKECMEPTVVKTMGFTVQHTSCRTKYFIVLILILKLLLLQ